MPDYPIKIVGLIILSEHGYPVTPDAGRQQITGIIDGQGGDNA